MTLERKPTHQDDLERMLRILADAPVGGLSIDEIHEATKGGETWSHRTINDLLCDLRPQITIEKVRVKHQKITKYELKLKRAS